MVHHFVGRMSNCLMESESRRFVFENAAGIEILDRKLIRDCSTSSHLEIATDTEILGSRSFPSCESLSSISLESNS
jgi:hypothetical protein